MSKQHVKRWTALVLTLVMALGLAVPAMGATPMMTPGETVAETPAIDGVGTMPTHSHSPAVADTPAIGEDDLATTLADANPDYIHNFTKQGTTTAGIYTSITGKTASDAKYNLPMTYGDLELTSALKMESSTKVEFKAPEKGVMILVFSTPGQKVKLDGTSTTIPSDGILRWDVTAGTHAVTKDSTNTTLAYMEFQSAHTHVWSDWTVTKPASCTEEGQRQRTCSAEGCEIGTQTETIAKLPHTSVNVAAVPAGCVTPGSTAGTKCSVCQTILSGCEPIPASGQHNFSGGVCTNCGMAQHTEHTWDAGTVTRQPTCTEAGEKLFHCTVEHCGETKTEPVAALQHDLKTVAAQAATCKDAGWNEYQQCSRCDYNTKVVISALGHIDENNDGNCDRCGNPMGAPLQGAGGWLETMYVETNQFAAADVAEVSWTGAMNGSMGPGNRFGYDMDYLVRTLNGKTRIDIPGVRAGTYTLTVTTEAGASYVAENIEVQAHDRSGYAHWNYTEGVGAYRDDGILKDEAIVIYVTEENKNTVALDAPDGTHVEGIGNILNTVGQESSERPGFCKRTSGKSVYWAKPNTNQGVLKKLAERNIPLVVRIVGNVSSKYPINDNTSADIVQGLTAYDAWDYGGSVGDNGSMARMKDCKNITIEGIGPDACVDGWGFHFMASSATPDYGKNFEVRNITFRNVPEDCIGMEGVQSGSAITAPILHGWVHNCSFYAPDIPNPAESDKDGGDGACDFKRGEFFTMDYCYYEGYHKTNLVGSSDSSLQYNITWHHNYYKNCESRGPLGRQANMHIYNCIYDGQTSYAMNTRADCYIFSEYNAFYSCKAPRDVAGGGIKSYNDALSSCINDSTSGVTTVTDKSQQVSTNNKYANFDTKAELSYIPSGNYKLDTDHAVARANTLAYAGPIKVLDEIKTPEQVGGSTVAEDRMPTASVVLPYDQAINSTYISTGHNEKDNVVFTLTSATSTGVKFGKDSIGQYVVFKVDEPVDVTLDGAASVLVAANSKATVAEIPGSAKNLPAGIYYVQSSSIQPAKGTTPMSYKDGNLYHLTITKAASATPPHEHSYTIDGGVVREATCTLEGLHKYSCSCGDVKSEIIPMIDHVDEAPADGLCDMCELDMGIITPDDPTKPKVPVDSVTVTSPANKTLNLLQGESAQIEVSILPADATNKAVAYSSSNPAVATVGTKGVVLAKTPGTTTITVTASDNKTDFVTVTVTGVTREQFTFNATDQGQQPADNNPAANGLQVGTNNYFTVTGNNAVWRTQNKETDKTTASLQVGSQESSGLSFTVPAGSQANVVISFASTGTNNTSAVALFNADGQRQLSLAGNYLGYIKGTAGGKVTFENVPAGTYTIKAPKNVNPADVGLEKWADPTNTSDPSNPNNRGTRITTVNVIQITSTGSTDYKPVKTITFEKNTLELTAGESYTLNYTLDPVDTSNPTLTWVSSDPSVARVNKNTIRAVAPGETTVTARAVSGATATCKVTVKQDPSQVIHIKKLSITGADTVAVEGVITMAAVVEPENATCEVVWSVDDSSVAKINAQGELTGLRDGVVTVIASTPHTDDARAEKTVVVGKGAPENTLDGAYKDLGWRYVPLTEKLTITNMSAEDTVLAATYDAAGRMTGVVKLTVSEATATISKSAAKLKLFWVNTVEQPMCDDVTVYGGN